MYRYTIHCCKKVLEATKLAYANKSKQFNHSKKYNTHDIWWIAGGMLNKGKSIIFPLSNGLEVLSSESE